MDLEILPSVEKLTYDQYVKDIKQNASNNEIIEKIVFEILENPALNTFSEFLELDEVSHQWLSHL